VCALTSNGFLRQAPLVREISWTNNILMLSKTMSSEEVESYLKLTIRERYSKRELERQIDSGLFERWELSGRTWDQSIIDSNDRPIIFKEVYVLDFLDLPHPFSERDLQAAIIRDLRSFLLEAGKDLTLLGENVRLQIGKHDYYVDLLFFHRELSCLVVFELKIEDFKPEHIGKMNFYLEAIDRTLKKSNENPSVGIILCRGKDDDVIEYAMSRNISPTLVAEYKTKLIPKAQLEQRLREFPEMFHERFPS
jgi:predicted nuclease of restriction endonuclease-like (RecB) superfamily